MNDLIPRVEAVLFASSDPISTAKLLKEMGIERTLLLQVMEYLKEKYNQPESGIQLVEIADGYQILSKPQYNDMLEKFFGNRKISKLSTPALEALAIIAYKQPITRQEVEEIRGVNCDAVIKTLMDRDLIVKRGHAELPGRPSLYYTTKKFLSYFKITSLKELPSIEELAENESQEDLFEDKAE